MTTFTQHSSPADRDPDAAVQMEGPRLPLSSDIVKVPSYLGPFWCWAGGGEGWRLVDSISRGRGSRPTADDDGELCGVCSGGEIVCGPSGYTPCPSCCGELPTLGELAREASGCFVTATRDDGSTFLKLSRVAHGAWVDDLVFAAHGDFLPDDWRFRVIREALDMIADDGDDGDLDDMGHEFADGASIYTADLTAWLASNTNRVGYCDEYADEFSTTADLVGRISGGQYMERSEVWQLVLTALRDRLDELDV